jgi:hypothetical protein
MFQELHRACAIQIPRADITKHFPLKTAERLAIHVDANPKQFLLDLSAVTCQASQYPTTQVAGDER